MIEIKTVKVSEKGIKDEFQHLLKHSETVAKQFWGTKADDVWDSIHRGLEDAAKGRVRER